MAARSTTADGKSVSTTHIVWHSSSQIGSLAALTRNEKPMHQNGQQQEPGDGPFIDEIQNSLPHEPSLCRDDQNDRQVTARSQAFNKKNALLVNPLGYA